MTEIVYDIGLDPGFYEGETHTVTSTITEGGSGLVPDNLWITIYEESSGDIINSKNRAVLSPVSTYITPAGILTYNFLPDDCVLVGTLDVRASEIHRVIFEFNWLSAARVGFIVGNWKVKPTMKQLDT
jgi:hypothetical protein